MIASRHWTCKSCGEEKDDWLIVEWGVCGECFTLVPGGARR